MLSRLPALLRRDDGMTLMELVVAMTISTMVLTMCLVFFLTAENDGTKSVLTNEAVADARNVLTDWTSLFRVAGWLDPSVKTDRFEEVTPTKIVFYANLKNLATADQTTGKPTKVALELRVTNALLGEGQLIEVVFNSDNTTAASIRQLAFDVTPTGGAGMPIFQPYNEVGGPINPANTLGCYANGTATAGLCLQSPPAGAGMLDPAVAADSLTVSSGALRANPSLGADAALDVNARLQSIGGVGIAFTATDSSNRVQVPFTGSASVNSGFAS